MTLTARRAFVALDEWLGIAAVLYVHRCDPALFWPVLALFIAFGWAVAYFGLWVYEAPEWRKAWREFRTGETRAPAAALDALLAANAGEERA